MLTAISKLIFSSGPTVIMMWNDKIVTIMSMLWSIVNNKEDNNHAKSTTLKPT